ncbi:MAG: hypothetical protein PUB09_01980 [Firmicutes bacterium]|nr:hypothetical protein [Bacillota bacterium]
MENILIAIVSGDEAYGKALSRSLLSACKNIIIENYGSREFVKAWSEFSGKSEYYKQFDIVLWAGPEISDAYGDNIVYLAEKVSMARKNYADKKFCLYKYSNAQTLVASIFEIYGFLTGRRAMCLHDGNVRLMAFASWAGGSGCSTIAWAVAQELCRFQDMKVLYLSLEELESTGEYVRPQAGIRSAGEYLYRLLGNKGVGRECFGDEMPFIDGYVVKDVFGIEAFAPTKGRNPLISLCERDMQRFLAAIVDCGRYNAVIMDLGTSLSEASVASMQMAENICLVARYGDKKYREEQYVSHVMCSAGEEVLNKTMRIDNMVKGKRDYFGQTGVLDVDLDHAIRFADGFDSGENFESFLEGDFGEDIKSLTGKLFNYS